MTKPTIEEVLGEFNAGVFLQQVDHVLKQVALGVINHGDKGKKGKVNLSFTLTRLGEDSDMVNVEHQWTFERPTMRGKATEANLTNTPMCVSKDGDLSVYPLSQTDLFEKPTPAAPLRAINNGN